MGLCRTDIGQSRPEICLTVFSFGSSDFRGRRLQLDRVAVGVLDVERGAGALGAVALDDLAGRDAVPGEMGAERRLVEAFEADAEMGEGVGLRARTGAGLPAEPGIEGHEVDERRAGAQL